MRRILGLSLIFLGVLLLWMLGERALRPRGEASVSTGMSSAPALIPPPVEILTPAAGTWMVDREDLAPQAPAAEGLPQRGPFRILSCTPSQCVLEFSLPAYALVEETDEEGRVWSVLQVEGTPLRNALGQPRIPWFSLQYGTLPGAEVTVEWRADAVEERAAPWPRPGTGPRLASEPRMSSLASREIPAEYGSVTGNGLPPAAWLSSDYQIRGIQGSGVSLTPCQYDFQQGVYRIATRGTLVLRSTAAESPQADAQQDFATLQRRLFVNGTTFAAAETAPVGTLGVVIPSDWKESEALQQYLQWRRSLGWTVLEASYPQETGEGRDAVLQQARTWYEQEGATHLLLLGDLRQIPPYQFSSADSYPLTPPYREICTDVPYALLAGEGDLAYPDLFLGRLPVGDLNSLEAYLTGLVRYEQGAEAQDAWTRRGIYLGSADTAICWPYQGQSDWENVSRQKSRMEEKGILNASACFSDPSLQENLLCPEEVAAALNQGASLLLYLGHGHCLSFKTTNFHSLVAKTLSPSGRAAFWMTPVCDAGRLDHAMAEGGDECSDSYSPLGQALFQNVAGDFAALGAVMGSATTFWDPTIVQLDSFGESVAESRGPYRLATTGAYAARGMVESLAFCENYRAAYQEAKQEGTTMANGGYTAKDAIYHAWSIAFLGDPSALLRVGRQSPLEVACQWREGQLHCQVLGLLGEDGEKQPVSQAIVVFARNGEECAGRTDAEGQVVLTPESQEAALWGELRVLDASAPLQNYRVPLADGNGDGVVTNQEMFQWLSLWQKEYSGAEESQEALALRAAAVSQWQEVVPSREVSDVQEPVAGEVPAARLAKVTLPLTASALETAAGAGLPLLSRSEDSFTVRANEEEQSWLSAQNLSPLAVSSFPQVAPARSGKALRERMEEMSRRGWPFFRLSRLGTTASGEPLVALRVSFQEDTPKEVLPQVMLCAGLSGDEAASVETLMAFLEAAWQARTGQGDVTLREILERCVLWMAPLGNPEGYGTGTPQNGQGVELDWGYPANAGTLAQGTPLGWETLWSHPTCQGPQALSPQPEQLALARWVTLRHPSALVVLRQGDVALSCGKGTALALGEAWAQETGLPTPVTFTQRYPSAGRFPQWVEEYLEIPSLELSLDDAGRQQATSLFQSLLAVILEGQGGTVRDQETQAPIPYARVFRQEDGLSVSTDHQGRYFLPLPSESLGFQAEGWEEGASPALTPATAPLLLSLPEHIRFLPGVPGSQRFLGRHIPANSLARLSLESEGAWEVPEDSGAVCRRGDGFLDLLWLEAPSGSVSLALEVTPSSEAPGEIALAATLFTQEKGQETRRRVLLAPVEESFTLSWQAGWNLLSVPMEGIRPEDLPADGWFCWREGGFLPFQDRLLTPGEGYFAHFAAPGTKTLTGAWTDQGERSLEAGWHLLGPLSSHFPQEDSPVYTMGKEGWIPVAPESRALKPGEVHMRLLPKDGLVTP